MTNWPRKLKRKRPRSPDRRYYPAFLDVAGKRCVIIGGGRVAERKCSAFLDAGASVTVVSPKITSRLRNYSERGLIKHIDRRYRGGDLDNAFIAVSATESEETNRKVAADASERCVLLNVVDNAPLCDFIAPSVFRRGPLTVAISTGGVSPAFAAAMRRELEGLYGTAISRYLTFLAEIRSRALREVGDKTSRERFLKGLGSERIVRILCKKGFREARDMALASYRKLSSNLRHEASALPTARHVRRQGNSA